VKRSGLLAREEAAYRRGLRDGHRFMRQLMYDLMCIALNETEGFGFERLSRLCDKLATLHDEYAVIFNSDSKDQEYSRAVLDRKLRQIAGDEHFIPWEERYANY